MDEFFKHMFESFTLYDIILCIVAGFIFTGIYKFIIDAHRPPIDINSILLYLIVGFILKNACSIVPFRTSIHALNIVIFLGVCVLLGYIIGLLYESKFFKAIIHLFRIRSTPQKSIWGDITHKEESLWVLIGYKDLDLKYYGILRYYEGAQRIPQIALYGYTKGGFEEDLSQHNSENPNDHTGNMNEFVLLDTSKADFIEFTSTNGTREEEKEKEKEMKKKEK